MYINILQTRYFAHGDIGTTTNEGRRWDACGRGRRWGTKMSFHLIYRGVGRKYGGIISSMVLYTYVCLYLIL